MAKISVCIPTYQSAATLGRAIDSVLRQRGVDVDLIIGDNASTDDTAQVVAQHNDGRIQYLRHEHNIGYPANVNSCLERVTGDYVVIVCADDFLIHDKVLAQLLSELEQTPGAVASHAPFQLHQELPTRCDPVGRPFSPLAPGLNTSEQVLSSFTNGQGCFGWGWMFRSELLSRHGLRFETDHDMAPDTMFWLTVSLKGPVAELRSGEPAYAFVMHPDSLGGRIFNERALKVYDQLVTFETRLFDRLRAEQPALARMLASRQFRYTSSEFAGLVQKAFSDGKVSRAKAFGLMSHAIRRHPGATMNVRFLRNFVFMLLPAALRRRILAARQSAPAGVPGTP